MLVPVSESAWDAASEAVEAVVAEAQAVQEQVRDVRDHLMHHQLCELYNLCRYDVHSHTLFTLNILNAVYVMYNLCIQ